MKIGLSCSLTSKAHMNRSSRLHSTLRNSEVAGDV